MEDDEEGREGEKKLIEGRIEMDDLKGEGRRRKWFDDRKLKGKASCLCGSVFE